MKRVLFSIAAVALVIALAAGAALPVYAEGTAPVAENFEIKTFRNVSTGGSLSAYDPDGYVVGYEITTKPVKGEIRISDGGLFVYMPMKTSGAETISATKTSIMTATIPRRPPSLSK